MEKDYYTVELIFDPKDTSACAGVRSFLEGFYHLTPIRIEAAIAKGKILLKRNAGYREAKTILQRVCIEGTKCNLNKQIHALPDNTGIAKNNLTEHIVAKVTAKYVVCPNCRTKTKQPDTGECHQCGIIYSKINNSDTPKDRPDAVENTIHEEWKRTSDDVPGGPLEKRLLSARKLIGRIAGWLRDVHQWKKQHFSALIDCGILFLTALILEIALLSLGKYLWFILSSTEAGAHYAQTHPEAATLIRDLLGAGAVALSISVVSWVLTINLLLSFIARIICLDRFYLDSDSVFFKTMWTLSSVLLSAWVLCQKELCPSFTFAFVVTLPPTFCLVKSCLKLTKTILPEIGSIITGIVQMQSNLGILLTGIKKRWRA